MSTQCSHMFQEGDQKVQCTRPAMAQGLCIVHAQPDTKTPEAVRQAIERDVHDAHCQVIDLRQGNFDGDFLSNLAIDKAVLFDGAYLQRFRVKDTVFGETCSFRQATFMRGTEWKSLHFRKDLIMTSCSFRREAAHIAGIDLSGNLLFDKVSSNTDLTFSALKVAGDADFSGLNIDGGGLSIYSDSHFGGMVKFNGARISGGLRVSDTALHGRTSFELAVPSGGATFRSVQFLGKTTFSAAMSGGSAPSFVDCNMKGARVLSIPFFSQGTELDPVFHNCTWPRKRYLGLLGRLCVADEEDGEVSLRLLQYYHRFHQQYYNLKDFETATEFYVSYMVTKRKVRKGNLWAKTFDYAYSLLSRYGESIWRPFIALLIMWLVVPAVLYSFDLVKAVDISSVDLGGLDYWKVFMANLSWTLLDRSGLSKLGVGSVGHTIIFAETFLNILFLAFLALGIRRTFVPKKPLDKA